MSFSLIQLSLSLIFLATFLAVFFFTDSWFSVARLHTTLWTLLYFGYVIFSGGDVLDGGGVVWLIFSCLLMLVGEWCADAYVRKHPKKEDLPAKEPTADGRARMDRLFTLAVVGFSLLSVIGSISEIYSYGFDLSWLLSAKKILQMSNEVANMRYAGIEVPAIVTLLETQKYIASLVGGYYLLRADGKARRALCFLPVFPIVLNVLVENTKAGVIACLLLFCIGFAIGYVTKYHRMIRFTTGQAVLVCSLGGLVLLFLVFAMMIRTGHIDAEAFHAVSEKFIVYAFGNVKAFDIWLSRVYSFHGWEFGINTFMAPFHVLGLVTRQQGVYDYVPGATSNVFSAYRGVIEDFGLVGGLAFVFLLGFLGALFIRRLREKPDGVWLKVGYAMIAFLLLYGMIISPYIYSSYCIAMVEFLAILLTERWVCRKK